MIAQSFKTVSDGYAVQCDRCLKPFGPRFGSRGEAKMWLEDDDRDWEPNGVFYTRSSFEPLVPRPHTLFHRVGQKFYCPACTNALVESTKAK